MKRRRGPQTPSDYTIRLLVQLPLEMWVLLIAATLDAAWEMGKQSSQWGLLCRVSRLWYRIVTEQSLALLTRLDFGFLTHLYGRLQVCHGGINIRPAIQLDAIQHFSCAHFAQVTDTYFGQVGDPNHPVRLARNTLYGLTSLRSLRLESNIYTRPLRPDACLSLARLSTSLTSLSLANDVTLAHADVALLCTRLRELDLSAQQRGMCDEYLSQFTALRVLSIGANIKLSNAAIQPLTLLKRLDLRSNQRIARPFGSQGSFDGLTHLTRLTDLTLSRVDFRCDARWLEHDLKKALPKLRYFRMVDKYQPCYFPVLS